MQLSTKSDDRDPAVLKYSAGQYAKKLQGHFETYFRQMLQHEMSLLPHAKNPYLQDAFLESVQKAKVALKCIIYPNDADALKVYQQIYRQNDQHTAYLISQYTRWIMQLLGKLAECMVLEHCSEDPDFNIVCMNIALFRPDIFKEYPDIDYSAYTAFSPSFKIIVKQESGIYTVHHSLYYSPHDTTADIAWCRRDNHLNQLMTELPELGYHGAAKLQIKTSLHCAGLDLTPYALTPVICFDLVDGFSALKEKYPDQILFSGCALFPETKLELENYFRILGAYACGMTDHINLSDLEIADNPELSALFRMPVDRLVTPLTDKQMDVLNTSGVIQLVQRYQQPIILGV